MTLLELKKAQEQIIQKIRENYGEVDDATFNELELSNSEIAEKVDAYIFVLKDTLKLETEYWQRIKKEADTILKRIKKNKENLEYRLHQFATEFTLEGTTHKIVPTNSVQHKIGLLSDIEDKYGSHIVEISGKDWDKLKDLLNQYDIEHKHKVTVTQLPENHKAIEEIIRPTIKILKK